MKKKLSLLVLVLILSLAMFGCDNKAEEPATTANNTEAVESTEAVVEETTTLAGIGETPVLVTSFGQSADVAMLKALFAKTGVDITYDPVIDADAISDIKTIVVAAGASTKGLGAAGIKPEEELERAQAIIDFAKENDIKIVVAHLGGSSRRGDLSDQFIDIAVSNATALIVVEEGNEDGYFSTVSEDNNIPLSLVDTISSAVTPLEEVFK